MRFFGKKQIFFVALLISSVATFTYLLFLFNSEAFAATYLKNIKLENSSSSTQYHLESTSPPCSTGGIMEREIEGYATGTTTLYGSYLSCQRKTESYIFTTVKDNCELSPPYSTSRDTGENCNEIPITALNTLSLNAGSVRETWSTAGCALLCSFPFEWSGFDITTGESSLTLRIDCQGEKKARLLDIEAEGIIISEAQPTGMEFSINGFQPSSVYPEDSYYSDLYKVYGWSGIFKWKIPIDRKCGETIIMTPSVANGYSQIILNSVKAILIECTVDISPPDVMPQKTGNNVADVVVTLSNPAPLGGVDMKITVEATEGSGGHSHNSSRLKGEISNSSGKIDTITFLEGETEKRMQYKATEVSGEEKIIAEVIDDKESRCESPVRVRVPGLFNLGVGGSYRLKGNIGRAAIHPNNHNGAGSTIIRTHYMANDFYEQFNATLGINDMSLPGGGLFDIDGDWDTPHSSHRKGTSVDIDRCALSATNPNNIEDQFCIGLGYPKGYIQVNRDRIERICINHGGYLENESTIHCEFSRAGSLFISVLPIGDGGGDTGGDTSGGPVDGGQIPQ